MKLYAILAAVSFSGLSACAMEQFNSVREASQDSEFKEQIDVSLAESKTKMFKGRTTATEEEIINARNISLRLLKIYLQNIFLTRSDVSKKDLHSAMEKLQKAIYTDKQKTSDVVRAIEKLLQLVGIDEETRTDITEHQSKYDYLYERYQSYQEELTNVKREKQDLKSELKNEQSKNKNLSQKLSLQGKELAKMRKDMERKQSTIDQLNNDLSALQEQLEQKERQLEKLSLSYNSALAARKIEKNIKAKKKR